MHEIVVVLGLLLCATALVPLADRVQVAYPILLVVGGLLLGFVPNSIFPDVVLEPDLVFLLFLPPLLYWAALTTPWREFREHLRIIGFLAVGLVLATTLGVALVAHAAISGLTLPLALVLGAIVSPPDAVAATAIADRLGLPRRVASILEGESLVNDATALVVYTGAVSAVTLADFSPVDIGLRFVWAAGGGIAVGIAVGYVVIALRQRIDDEVLENAVSILTPFAAYLPADLLGSSGVLATVATGFVVQRYSPLVFGSATRLRADSVWELINFVLNGLTFILIGLQLHPIFLALVGDSLSRLILEGAIVSGAAIVLRIGWIFAGRALFRRLSRFNPDDLLTTGEATVVAWSGMRGVVSLAAAESLPFSFPHRNLILFLAFSVILATLVIQGLSLPPLIQAVGLSESDEVLREELRARLATTEAALSALDRLAGELNVPSDLAEGIRARYSNRVQVLSARLEGRAESRIRAAVGAQRALQRALVAVERDTLIELRYRNEINDATLRDIQRDLDLEEVRLGERA